MTNATLGFRTRVMKSATPGPWTPSLATTRCQNCQPFLARSTLVADGEMLGILPSSSTGPTFLDSPENAGPISPTILSVLIAVCASGTACSGLPWLSYLTSSTLTLGLVALYCSTASVAPLYGGVT